MVTYEQVRSDEEIKALIGAADNILNVMQYTEHGTRHVTYVANTASKILQKLGYPENLQELAKICGYLHDIGNAINRHNHGITGAIMVYPILLRLGMPLEDIAIIVSAIGNHEEELGVAVNPVSAAVIIADKSDAHRTRVRRDSYDPTDIHDRVNFSILKNIVTVKSEKRIIASNFYMDKSSSVMEYFQIYLSRIQMSEHAAAYLNCAFQLYINDVLINTPKQKVVPPSDINDQVN
ncbi:MAG: HD domain-containing protein [Clostridiaceae bacterium]|jgi:putative nucleotidyltransferase with HDIG domain|nr:HD domain-containing protein [Clostridiaceae bacterium]